MNRWRFSSTGKMSTCSISWLSSITSAFSTPVILRFVRPCFVELLGTCVYVLVGTMAAAVEHNSVVVLTTAMSQAVCMALMQMLFGHIRSVGVWYRNEPIPHSSVVATSTLLLHLAPSWPVAFTSFCACSSSYRRCWERSLAQHLPHIVWRRACIGA